MDPKLSLYKPNLFKDLRYDLPAALVVFLVALPLCLGIALASEAPLFSGIVTGIVAGILVGLLSGSELSVSGPAAGLTVIVASSIKGLGGFEVFLCAVVISGAFQILLGFLRAGSLASLFPLSVIKGMLVAIGITIVLKQIPHALGGVGEFNDEMGYWHITGADSVVGQILNSFIHLNLGAFLISVVSIALLIVWENIFAKKSQWGKLIPGALVTVVLGSTLNQVFHLGFPSLALTADGGHMVQLPHISSFSDLKSVMTFPDFSGFTRMDVWMAAITLSLIGSVETLLCIESTDKMDPFKRISNTNQELVAQGVGNMVAGFAGGLPMTSVIVRSSANIYSGARSRLSTIFHGVFFLICIFLIPNLLNLIPLSSLAAVLVLVGYKLAHPSFFVKMFKSGLDQFIPFIVTVIAIMMTNLLTGVLIGLAVGIGVVLKASYYSAIQVTQEGPDYLIRFTKDVTFVHKMRLRKILMDVKNGAKVAVDGSRAMFIDQDIYELLKDFAELSEYRKINLELRNMNNKKFDFLMKKVT